MVAVPLPKNEPVDVKSLAAQIAQARSAFENIDFKGAMVALDHALAKEQTVAGEENAFEREEHELADRRREVPKFRDIKKERAARGELEEKDELTVDEFLRILEFNVAEPSNNVHTLLVQKFIKFRNKKFQILNYHQKHVMLAGLHEVEHIPGIPAGWIPCTKHVLEKVLTIATNPVVEKMQPEVSAAELCRYIIFIRAQGSNDSVIKEHVLKHKVRHGSHYAIVDDYHHKNGKDFIHFHEYPKHIWIPLNPTAVNDAVIVTRNLKQIELLLHKKAPYKIANLVQFMKRSSPSDALINDHLIRSFREFDKAFSPDIVEDLVRIRTYFVSF
ncbi:hypothetical protein HN587_04595 [Candidatus Woesearchaeota archaeon]|jgi:hypothetical protein|nr:hypothetical protein [Candidatus Woesearchaeota archaeon]